MNLKKIFNILYYKKDLLSIISLLFISIISHYNWFSWKSILTFSDWQYWPHQALIEIWYSWGTWISFFGFGLGNTQISFYPFKFFWSLFPIIGLSYDITTKITFFIPIAVLGFLSPFFFIKYFTKDYLISFVGALFYGTTTYFLLKQTGHLPIAFVYALFPLIFILFLKALQKNTLFFWIIFVFFLWIATFYELRIAYVLIFIFFGYFLSFHAINIHKYIFNILFSGTLFIFLNFFWLTPIFFGGLSEQVTELANRGLFGNELFNLKQSFTLFEWSWTGSAPNMEFIAQPIPIQSWILPIIIFFLFGIGIFEKDIKYKRNILYFSIISLVGIFLTKQSSEPFPHIYKWLYLNFPGFNLYREASKFYIVTAFGYLGLFSLGLFLLKKRSKYIFYGCLIVITFLSFLNIKPLINQKIETLFISRKIPSDYLEMEKVITVESKYFRSLWIPTDSRWSFYSNQNPKMNMIGALESYWKHFIYTENQKKLLPAQESISSMLELPFSDQLFDISSIRYVSIPLQDTANDDDFFIHYGGRNNPNIRQWYIDQLDTKNWLQKINIGTKDLVIYENKDFRPHIYTTKKEETIYENVPFEEVLHTFKNPTEYTIRLENISQSIWLNFSEKYHPDWKVRIGEFHWWEILWKGDTYFLSDEFHKENNAKLNSFLIDPKVICKQYSCISKGDGSFDMNITLYFRPQSYFYFGLIISLTTFVGCVGYLTWYSARKWYLYKKAKKA